MTNEQVYRLALKNCRGIGDIVLRKLIDIAGSAEAIYGMSKKMLKEELRLSKNTIDAIANSEILDRAFQEREFVLSHDISCISYDDEAYPNRLNFCADAPALLFAKGNFNFNTQKVVSVVGTRNATTYGKQRTQDIIEGLSEYKDLLIVSGLAYGIDIIAHKTAIDCGLQTVAVVGHGLDMLYPSDHKKQATEMQENGGLLTEFMSKTIPDKENFPKRNRIVAGMADATIVIESRLKGGAMITAEMAFGYNRELMALPGRSIDEVSLGCNKLIKALKASMIEDASDVQRLMGWAEKPKIKQVQKSLMLALSPEEQLLVDLIQTHGKISADELCNALEKPISAVSGLLFNLELEGIVKALPGKQFSLT